MSGGGGGCNFENLGFLWKRWFVHAGLLGGGAQGPGMQGKGGGGKGHKLGHEMFGRQMGGRKLGHEIFDRRMGGHKLGHEMFGQKWNVTNYVTRCLAE